MMVEKIREVVTGAAAPSADDAAQAEKSLVDRAKEKLQSLSKEKAAEDGVDKGAEKEKTKDRSAGNETVNFLTYVRERMDTFEERDLCGVDSLVFSWLSYARMGISQDRACTHEGIALHELLRAEDFEHMFGTSWDPFGSRDLLFAVCASPRFRTSRLTEFRFKTDMGAEEQFAAMTFALPAGASYVAFRGTDSTIVGWKEDFNMTFLKPVPAQQEAVNYLNDVMAVTEGPVYVGGHSKGGNLAVYAAAMVAPEYRGRIKRVFSHDGPGFHRDFVATEQYQSLMPLVEKTVPKSAMIGQVLSEDAALNTTVVESDSFSLLQHNPFLWHVDVDACSFVEADGLSVSSRYFNEVLDTWMDKYELSERQRFVDTMFDVIGVTGANRFGDIMADRKRTIPLILEAADKLDPEVRQFIIDVCKTFAKTATVERVSGAAGDLLDTLKSGLPTQEASLALDEESLEASLRALSDVRERLAVDDDTYFENSSVRS